jgi:phosphoserine phosphatase RsbU/P
MTNPEVNGTEKIPTVVIIDDDPTSALILESMLEKEGILYITAGSGIEGRGLVKSWQPDLVLLDIYMPDESGFETCRIIKEDPHTADIPIIFITSKTDAQSKIKGFELGAVDYITKPYMAAEVLARVRVHIRLRSSIKSYLEAQVSRLRQLTEAQEAIMPAPVDLPEARFAVAYRPAYEAGGDFYDVLHTGEGMYDYIVADVSGHDLGASLATSALKALLHQGKSALYSPAETLRMINQVLNSAFPEELYLTLAYVRLNRKKGRLTLISAGHPDFILLKKDGELTKLSPRGDVLGAFEYIHLDMVELPIEEGDRFFLYSDGLIEYDGEKSVTREQGSRRLMKMIKDMEGLALEDLVWSVSLTISPEVIHPADDILFLGVEI